MNFGFYIQNKNFRIKVETTNICDWPKGNPFKPQTDIVDYKELQMKRVRKSWYIKPIIIDMVKNIYY